MDAVVTGLVGALLVLLLGWIKLDINRLTDKVERLDERLNGRIDSLSARIDDLAQRVARVEARLGIDVPDERAGS